MVRKRKLRYVCEKCGWSLVMPFKSALCASCGELGISRCHCSGDLKLIKEGNN